MRSVDITRDMDIYAEARRHIWNVFFLPEMRNIEQSRQIDRFQDIDESLLDAIVCEKHGIIVPRDFGSQESVVDGIAVRPERGQSTIDVMVGERVPGSLGSMRYHESGKFSIETIDLRFSSFFDWNAYDFIHCSLVKCLVLRCDSDESMEGNFCLVRRTDVRFCLPETPARQT